MRKNSNALYIFQKIMMAHCISKFRSDNRNFIYLKIKLKKIESSRDSQREFQI